MKKRTRSASLREDRRTRATSTRPLAASVRLRLEQSVYVALFFLVALAFSTRLEIQFTLPKLLIIRALTPILAGFWAIRLARNEIRPLPSLVLAAAIALGLWWAVTTIFAVHQPTAIHGAHGRYNGLWNQLLFLFLFLIVASSRFDASEVERLTICLVAALVPVSVYAIAQYAGWDPIRWPGERSASTIGNPVILAAKLALGMPFALAFLLLARRWRERFVWGAILAILLGAAVTTLSRGPLVAGVVGLVVVLAGVAWESRQRLNRIALAIALIMAVPLLVVGYRQVIQVRESIRGSGPSDTDRTIRDRFNTYRAALQIVRDHPIVGVGLENFGVVYPRYRSAESEQLTPDVLPTMVHSGYLQAAATTGIPGLALYLLFLGSVLGLLWRAYRRNTERHARRLLLAFVASISAYLIQDLSGWLEISLSMFFWIILGLGMALVGRRHAADSRPAWLPRVAVTAVSACSVCAIGLAVQSVEMVRADQLVKDAESLSVKDSWLQIAADLSEALTYSGADTVYLDKAGVRYAQRYALVGEHEIYQKSAALLEEAHRRDPFNPYFLLHRSDLETAALQKNAVNQTSPSAADAIRTALAIDPNNAAVHESGARLKLAERKPEDALKLVATARTLRPTQPRYDSLEGDIRRALDDRRGAADAYRRGIARLDPGNPEWLPMNHKLIVTLAESGSYEAAVTEARRVTAKVPSDGLAYTLLGIAYQAMNNLEASTQAYRSALQLNPVDATAKRGMQEIEAQIAAPR